MSGVSKKLFDTLDKLNEMGQLLLVVNNLSDVSDSDKKDLKSLAIKKDAQMLKSLETFKIDRNIDSLKRRWRALINSKDIQKIEIKQSFAENRPKSVPLIPGLAEKVRKTIKENFGLLSIREILCLDKQNPKDVVIQLKKAFNVKSSFSLPEFSDLILQIEATSEPWTNMTRTNALSSLFLVLDENKNNLLTKEEVFNNLIILSGGTPQEKISAVFCLYDTEGDGLITYENVLEHQKQTFRLMFLLSPGRKKLNQTPESLALATTEGIFQEIANNEKFISESEYLAWYNGQELDPSAATDKLSRLQARQAKKDKMLQELQGILQQLTSQENLKEIRTMKTSTGMGSVPVHDALRIFRQKNSSGYFSRQQFSEICSDLATKYNPSFKSTSDFYTAVYKLFTKFDRDGNGIIDTSELFCGLSIMCAGNLGDKISAVFDSFDESRDGIMQLPEVLQYFRVVFKMICSEDSSNIVSIEDISRESAENLFKSFGLTKDKAVTPFQLKAWFLKSRIRFL